MKAKQKIRIYIGKKKVVELSQSKKKGSTTNAVGVVDFIKYIRSKDAQAGKYQLKAKSLKELQQTFFSSYKILEAAGGVVFNEYHEILMIYRKGHWDLPKGKTEKGETIEETAVREVEEETGIKNIQLIQPVELLYNGLHTTYHTYVQDEKHILKPSYWYIMRAEKQQLVPQTEEDIEQAVWVPINEVENYYKDAYPAIVDVLKATLEMFNV